MTAGRFFVFITQMRHQYILQAIVVTAVGLIAAGCAKKTPTPVIASSADTPGYAVAYPEALGGRLTRYTEDAVAAREKSTAFQSYPDALSEPDWQVAAQVYTQADEAGRGKAFADQMAERYIVAQFFQEEKDDITRRTNNGVAAAIKKAECNCDVETHGAVAFALKEGVDKQLEKRLLDAAGTETIIEQNEKPLGKKNTKTLSTQAIDIAFTAHVVFVELPSLYQALEWQLSEAGHVRDTLYREKERENARLSSDDSTKAEKKAAEKRIADIDTALSSVDIFESETKQLLSRAETELPELQKKYEDAFDGLMDAVAARQKN